MAKSRGSKNFRSRKYKVKFDLSTLRTWVLPILRRIEAGDYPTQIGHLIGLSRQHVHYYLKKLQRCRLIHKEKRSSVVFYRLSTEGTNLLRSCEGVVFPGELYRLDKCQVCFGIRVEGVVPFDGFRRLEMQNWTALLGVEQGVKVRHTSKSWIVYVEVIRGSSPAEIYALALNLANRVAVALCKKYGCVLDEGRFVAGHVAVEDPVAELFGRYFTVSTPQRAIDHSWKVGELENFGKDAVIAYLQMPEGLKKVEERVDRLHADLEELTGVLKKFLCIEGSARASPDKSSLDRYVT